MSLASLKADAGSSVVVKARVQIPAWGRWWADVDLADDLDLDVGDSVTVPFAGALLVGTVVSGGTAYGRASYRIVGGADGWSTTVEANGYQDDAGVLASAVIRDTAAAVGETVSSPPETRGGTHFARANAAASSVLNALAPRAWYVDRDGVTYFGSRTETAYTGSDTIVMRKLTDSALELEVSDVTDFVPGINVDSLGAAVDVEYRLDAKRLTVRVQTGPRSTRELDAFRRVLDAVDPLRRYRSPHEYRVVTQDGNALNLQPVRVSAGMPDLARVPVRLGPGQKATHTLGSLVVVAFIEADPSRPIVIAGDDPDAPGWSPAKSETQGTEVLLGSAPQLGVARLTDTVVAGPWAGTITGASTTVKAGS